MPNGAPDAGTVAGPGLGRGESGDRAGPLPGSERHAWDVGVWWDVYFTCAMCGIVALALVTGPQEWRWLTAVLLAAAVVVYYTVVREYVASDGVRPRWVGPVALALLMLAPVLPAVVLNPTLTFVLVAFSPLAFMSRQVRSL